MCGKKLVKNLEYYIDSLELNIPIYRFDLNSEKELPCIVIGYDSEEATITGYEGHYTVSGFINICVQGYDDFDNSDADAYSDDILDALVDKVTLKSFLNTSEEDLRPATNFRLNDLFIRSVNRNIEGTSEEISIVFHAFCKNKD